MIFVAAGYSHLIMNNNQSGEKNWWTAAAALLALMMPGSPFAVYLNLADHGPTWLGLDDSARMALNWAWHEHINWGHDIIYTYGPLSFLSTRVGWGIPWAVLLLFDLFIVLNFFFLFRDIILGSRHRAPGLGIALLMAFAIPVFYGSGLSWVLTVFIYYWMYRSYQAPHPWQFTMLLLLITIAFYIKLNTGLFTIVFLLGYLALMLYTRRLSWPAAAATLGGLMLLIAGGAWCFNVSLPAYVKGAVEVMKGYNDLLYLYEDHPKEELRIMLLFWSMCAVLGLGAIQRVRQKDWVAAFLILISFAYLYLLKKQGLFRNDKQHIGEFFAYAPLVWLSGVCFLIWPRRKDIAIAIAGTFTIACIICAASADRSTPVTQKIMSRLGVLFNYPREVADFDPAGYANQPDKRILPLRVLLQIGSATTDVFPWDANYVLQNKLHYHPRPCFQTFQANSDYLQQANLKFYEQQGPQFVIYDYDGIDNAYPFNDAPALNLLLARNYRLADTFTSNDRWRILLQRRDAVTPFRLIPGATSAEALNASIPIHGSYLKLRVSYTIKGKLRAIWNRPAPLQIAYQRTNGEWLNYKTSPELLKTGVYAGYLIRSNKEFADFVANDTSGLEKIKALKLVGDTGHYKSAVAVDYYSLSQ